MCIYAILGFRSSVTGVSIDEVEAGTGITFVAITEAVTQMDGTPFFAFVFFFMLFNLGISSQFGKTSSTFFRFILQPKYGLQNKAGKRLHGRRMEFGPVPTIN